MPLEPNPVLKCLLARLASPPLKLNEDATSCFNCQLQWDETTYKYSRPLYKIHYKTFTVYATDIHGPT